MNKALTVAAIAALTQGQSTNFITSEEQSEVNLIAPIGNKPGMSVRWNHTEGQLKMSLRKLNVWAVNLYTTITLPSSA